MNLHLAQNDLLLYQSSNWSILCLTTGHEYEYGSFQITFAGAWEESRQAISRILDWHGYYLMGCLGYQSGFLRDSCHAWIDPFC